MAFVFRLFIALSLVGGSAALWFMQVPLWIQQVSSTTSIPLHITRLIIIAVTGVSGLYLLLQSKTSGITNSRGKRPIRSKDNEFGSSDLATRSEIKRWMRSVDEFDTPLSVKNLIGCSNGTIRNGKLIWPGSERNRHILIIAKTGSGKTTKAILPFLYNDCLNPHRSTIVIDSKPEMYSKLVPLTKAYNPKKKIILFNPLDLARSVSWNIVSKVEDETDVKLITNSIISATDSPNARQDSPFFRNNAMALLHAIMVGLLRDPSERLSIPRVHELVHSGKLNLCDWLNAHPHALRTARTFVELAQSGSQNADTLLSELSMRLSAWDLHAIRATTYFDELNLKSLIEEPTLFIVELRESEIDMLRPLANVMVVEMLRYLTKYAESCPGQTLPRPIGLVIDEFASAIGRLPDIHIKLNTLRSRNVSILAAIQSIAQIKANYGPDAESVLAGFNTKILMPTLDLADAEWGSKESGNMTIRFNTDSKGGNGRIIDWFSTRNYNRQEQVQQRPVLTPGEIGRSTDNFATFFLPDTPAFQGALVPYYQQPQMLKRISESEKAATNTKLRDKPIELEEHFPEADLALPTPAAGIGLPMGTLGNAQGGTSQLALPGRSAAIPAPRAAVPARKQRGVPSQARAEASAALENMSPQELVDLLFEIKLKLDWYAASPNAKKWWEALEDANVHQMPFVVTLAEELLKRSVTIDDFYATFLESRSPNVYDTLDRLDANARGNRGRGSGAQRDIEIARR